MSPANNENLALVDMQTGTVVRENVKMSGDEPRSKYVFPGGFAFMAMILVSKLAEVKMPSDCSRLMFKIMADANYGGIVMQPNAYYSRQLGISAQRVSRLIRHLHKLAILHRIGSRTVFLNPSYFWRGSVEEQKKALDTWSELRRSMLVQAKPMKKAA